MTKDIGITAETIHYLEIKNLESVSFNIDLVTVNEEKLDQHEA